MPYTLRRITADHHELLLDGAVVGRMTYTPPATGQRRSWRVALDPPIAASALPAPFTEPTRSIPTFAAAAVWLDLQLGGAIQRSG